MEKMLNLRCTQVLVDVTSHGCAELWIPEIVIDISNFTICFCLHMYIFTANISCEQNNGDPVRKSSH